MKRNERIKLEVGVYQAVGMDDISPEVMIVSSGVEDKVMRNTLS